MVLDINDQKKIIAFKQSLKNQVSMRLSGYGLKKADIDSVVNYMFKKSKGEYVDARYLNAIYHQAISELGLCKQPVFASSRFPAQESHISAMKK